MRKTCTVNVVERLEYLLEVVLADIFGERTRVEHIFEELAATDHLLSDVSDFD